MYYCGPQFCGPKLISKSFKQDPKFSSILKPCGWWQSFIPLSMVFDLLVIRLFTTTMVPKNKGFLFTQESLEGLFSNGLSSDFHDANRLEEKFAIKIQDAMISLEDSAIDVVVRWRNASWHTTPLFVCWRTSRIAQQNPTKKHGFSEFQWCATSNKKVQALGR